MNYDKISTAGTQQLRTPRYSHAWRDWPPRIAALASIMLAIGCSTATPLDRTNDASEHLPADASAPESSPTWCTVQAILAENCQRCHGSPRQHGAPFSLVSYDDTQAHEKKGKLRFERIAEVVADESMPARSITLDPPVEPLSDEARATILDWCAQGAPLTGSEVCEPDAP